MTTKKNLLIVFLLLLTIVNVAALATIAFYRFRPNRPFHAMGQRESPREFLRQQLDLTEEQALKFESHMEGFRAETKPILDSLRTRRAELREEMSTEKPSVAKLDRLTEEIGALEIGLKKKAIVHMLEGKSFLTPEQQRRFFSLFGEWGDTTGGLKGPGRWERPPGNPDFGIGR
jgi:Spy/CpxP family protein refolding chaperone